MRKFLGVSLAVGAFTILSGVAVAQLGQVRSMTRTELTGTR